MYGPAFLTAASRVANPASRDRAGFTVAGETRLSGLPGLTGRRSLTNVP
ncbi:hypothetical protein ACPCBC_11065 [Streptomyces incarnatus]|nr:MULTISPECIES: hypothetical protein [Streptomyces]